MTKTTQGQTSQSDDPLDQVIFELNDEQTMELNEVMANPPAANHALQDQISQTPPWETAKD